MSKRVTLADLAQMLNLDTSSVSLALRNSPKISAAMRARVQEAALRSRYRPSLATRRLRSGKTHLPGLALPSSLSALNNAVVVRT